MIQILIIDDHAVVREGLRLMLNARPGFSVVADVADGKTALEVAIKLTPDVILVDLLMPEMSGVEAIQLLKERGINSRILVLTSTLQNDLVQQAIEAGANGYVLKTSHVEDFVSAIRRVATGESVLDPAALQSVIEGLQHPSNRIDELTPREREVFDMVARGMPNREIATTLSLSEHTIRSHISNITEKLNLRDRVQVMVFALKRGLINPDDLY